jgi:magnesium chelatase subunit I
MVDLPLGATEDRVVGTLDLERALLDGTRSFEPGLLARANRGFLYIDEVNLLDDHLVDLLLDVAASGENVVEREGISIRHPARFVLVGSGNPEEGDLRPQLLDRFGLSVEVGTPRNVDDRIEVLRRRDAYDRDAEGFQRRWASQDGRVRKGLERARARLADVEVSDDFLRRASGLCVALGVDGLRGELTLLRAARALAALEDAKEVTPAHLAAVAPPSLRHRLRRDPLDESGSTERIDRALREMGANSCQTGRPRHPPPTPRRGPDVLPRTRIPWPPCSWRPIRRGSGARSCWARGPAVEGWCRFLRGSLPPGSPWRRVPVGVTPDRLTGGIDLAGTLRTGRRVLQPGIPAEADGGVLILPSAERIHPEVTAVLLEVLDRGRLRVEREGLSADLAARVGVVALDEAREDEPGSPEALRDRVAFLVTLPPRWTPDGSPTPKRWRRPGPASPVSRSPHPPCAPWPN